MLHEAAAMVLRLDLPEFLDADAEFLGLAILLQVELGDQLLGERTATSTRTSSTPPAAATR